MFLYYLTIHKYTTDSPDRRSQNRSVTYPIKPLRTGSAEVWTGCNIGLGITLPFYFIYHLHRCHEASPNRHHFYHSNNHLRRLCRPTPSSPSRPTSTLNSPHFPRFISCHHRPARAQYISTYLRRRASVRSYR